MDTDTSTPHISLNIHSLFGLLTRATTRGTANSCFDSNDTTRLSSSSPVTAATTSQPATPAAWRASQLTPVAPYPPDTWRRGVGMLTDDPWIVVEDLDLVTGRPELFGDETAHTATTDDQCFHFSISSAIRWIQ